MSSGQYDPIAGVSENNHGSVNTVTAVFLIVMTLIFSSIRYAIGRKRMLRLDTDDFVFVIALVFSIVTSLLSQQMVPSGLGRHYDTVSTKELERMYKLQYATHFLAIASMTCSKMSIILMFRRIDPAQASPIARILMPGCGLYTVVCLFLAAFQCQMPTPWILQPSTCWSKGQVHYVTSGLNIATDAVLAFWMIPIIWSLQMARGTRAVVISLVASRVIVCILDGTKVVFITKALNSGDYTWFSLGWAVIDQIVVHLSLNHATLPRVQIFLRNLQSGTTVLHIPTTASGTIKQNSSGSNLKNTHSQTASELKSDRTTTSSSGLRLWKSAKLNPFKTNRERHSVSVVQDAHSSSTQLRLQPDQGNELSTFVTVGDAESTSSGGNVKGEDIKVDHTVEIWTEPCGRP